MTHKTLEPSAVAAAAERLAGIVNRTPVMTSRSLNERVGCQVFLKCENFQRVGAFKFRGAYHAISRLDKAQQEAGVITHSSGNHAQGVALAARLLGVKAVIVMPEDAPAVKREATAGYGAAIVPCAAAEREQVTADLIARHGYTLIHPYDNDDIIAGQGTAAWELFDEVGPLDALFVPVGGGGLISGTALAAASRATGCRVVGVEPETAADAGRSWRQGRVRVLGRVPDTIADGLRTRFVGERNLAVMRRYVADMITVSEEAIWETMTFLWTRLKIIVEPSAAVALAPLFTGQYAHPGERVGVILSGGNVDPLQIQRQAAPSADASKTEAETAPAAHARPTRPRILVCDPVHEAGLRILRQVADVTISLDLSNKEVVSLIPDYQALIVGPRRHINDQMIEYGFKLRAIGNLASRLDNIDVSTARDMGIAVCNAPTGKSVAIAEHTMGRLLALANQFADGRLSGKTLALIGFGRIARQVALRAQAFDMRVIANQPRLTPELALSAGVEVVDLVEALQQADFVSLHLPFKPETNAIIAAAELAMMKPGACLINVGHTDLVDEAVLLHALNEGRIAGAAVSTMPPQAKAISEAAEQLRTHPRVLVHPHVTTIIGQQQEDISLAVSRQIADILRSAEASETLSLELVPIEMVMPHEQIDDKRVARLMKRLEADGRLVNPPVTTFWKGRYIILDGATRFTAFKRLKYPHIIVQVVQSEQKGFELHTWYHIICGKRPFSELLEAFRGIEGISLTPVPFEQAQSAAREEGSLCYFLDREGNAVLAQAQPGADRLAVLNALVATYIQWGHVERTLLTDLPRLLGQFPDMTAVAIFPQFKPETVFEVASQGRLLPAGLTRFVIPGRILRLNAKLARLKSDKPLQAKRAWFNRFLEKKLARSRLRYYQEPVILLDE